jgi:hypothetical protein
MCRLCSHKSPAQKSSAGFLPVEGGFCSTSCGDCDTSANPVTHLPPPSMGEGDRDSGGRGTRQRHIKLIAEGDTFPSEPFEPSEPGPLRGPWTIPQPSAAKPPSNLRTLRPERPVNLKNLFPNLLNPQTFPASRSRNWRPLASFGSSVTKRSISARALWYSPMDS